MPDEKGYAPNRTYVPFCMCLDVSGSMTANIDAMKLFIRKFQKAMKNFTVPTLCFDISTVMFGGETRNESIETSGFVKVDDNFHWEALEASEVSPLGKAVNQAVNILDSCKESYKSKGSDYKQPILLIISDGKDNDNAETLAKVQERVREKVLSGSGKLTVIPITFNGADEEVLQKFSPNIPATTWRGWDDNKFRDFIKLINASRENPDDNAIENAAKEVTEGIVAEIIKTLAGIEADASSNFD